MLLDRYRLALSASSLLAGSAAMALIGGAASATPLLDAEGSIALPSGTTSYSDNNGGTQDRPVNIIPYTSDSASGSSGFIHAYSDVSGSFGARSSGQGTYDVLSSIMFQDTITNSSAHALDAVLNYHITGGDVMVSGSGTADARLDIAIKRDGTSVAGASAEFGTMNGLVATDTSSSSIAGFAFSHVALGYSVPDAFGSVDLGLLGAGQSLTFSYAIAAHALGSAGLGDYTQQTVQQCHDYGPYHEITVDNGYGYGYGYGGTHTEIVPAGTACENVVILVPNSPNNYAEARSGDPLNAALGNGQTDPNGQYFDTLGFPGGSGANVKLNKVPEPSTLALVAGGLGLMRTRRRRTV